jgi:hypothetical protein
MLLAQCGIPFEVPVGLTTLTAISTEMQCKSGKDVTALQLLTKVRNTIIHSNEKKRKFLVEWEKAHSVKISDILWVTQQLFKWYITLVVLRLIGYSGKYANRLTPRRLDKRVEWVPWVT